MKSMHIAGTFTKKKTYIVTGVCSDILAWPGRDKEDIGKKRAYFGIKTVDRLIEFECGSKEDKLMLVFIGTVLCCQFHFFFLRNLTKTILMVNYEPKDAIGTEIFWFLKNCLTLNVLKEKPKKSFFNFFKHPEVLECSKDIDEDVIWHVIYINSRLNFPRIASYYSLNKLISFVTD
ncbi:nucleosome assembly protein 1;3-like [Trifolium pratense]|uniref:nucleosome assembly protein 1;3-like n=1 Tax=Trifolium pratense TaxID=57577 RepID=UPI001E695079|nr:nucleosome assembly protein 1;3-like [Trifolium pratense]